MWDKTIILKIMRSFLDNLKLILVSELKINVKYIYKITITSLIISSL